VELQWQRDQVSEPAAGQHILAREEPIVRVDAQSGAAGHRARQDHEAESARIRCGDRVRKEEPDMRAVS
jgi:hypothetical protein